MKIKSLLITLIFLSLSFQTEAQETEQKIYRYYDKSQVLLSWDIATPLSNNYISSTGFAGARLEYRYFTSRTLSFGGSIGWNTLEQYQSPDTYQQSQTSTVYTDMVRQIQLLPILATVHYYLSDSADRKPYVSLGAGANYAKVASYYNIFVSDEKTWGFAVRPEIGFQFFNSSGFGFNVHVAYSYASNKTEELANLDGLQGLNYGIGIIWTY